MAGSARGIRAGRAYVEIGASDKLTSALKRIEARMSAFGAAIRKVGVAMTALGGATVTGLFALTKAFANTGDNLLDMSTRTGATVEALSELGYVAKLNGSSLEELEGGLKFMQRGLAEAAGGSKSAVKNFDRLGLSVDRLLQLAPDQQFEAIAQAIAGLADPAQRTAAAMEIFGRSGTSLLPIISLGAAGIEDLRQKARDLGIVMSTDAAQSASDLNDALDTATSAVGGAVNAIGTALAPEIKRVAEWFTRAVTAVTRFIKANQQLVVTVLAVAAGVTALGIGLIVLGTVVQAAGAVFGVFALAITAAVKVLAIAKAALLFLFSPIGLIIAAVTALGVALLHYSGLGAKALGWLGDRFAELGAFVGQVVGGISSALAGGDIELAANILWAALKVAFLSGKTAVLEIWDSIWMDARASFEAVTTNLASIWVNFTSFIGKAWVRIGQFVEDTWNDVTGGIADGMLWIQGLFDDTLDVAAAQAARAAEDERASKARAAAADAEIQALESERAATQSALEGDLNARLSKIGNEESSAKQAAADLAKAKADLAASIAKAKALPGLSGSGFAAGSTQLQAAAATPVAPSASVGTTRGIFGAQNLDSLVGGGGSAAERTAKATEESARTLKRIDSYQRAMADVGLAVT